MSRHFHHVLGVSRKVYETLGDTGYLEGSRVLREIVGCRALYEVPEHTVCIQEALR